MLYFVENADFITIHAGFLPFTQNEQKGDWKKHQSKKQVKQLEFEYNKSSNIQFDELDSDKSSRFDSFLKMLNNKT